MVVVVAVAGIVVVPLHLVALVRAGRAWGTCASVGLLAVQLTVSVLSSILYYLFADVPGGDFGFLDHLINTVAAGMVGGLGGAVVDLMVLARVSDLQRLADLNEHEALDRQADLFD